MPEGGPDPETPPPVQPAAAPLPVRPAILGGSPGVSGSPSPAPAASDEPTLSLADFEEDGPRGPADGTTERPPARPAVAPPHADEELPCPTCRYDLRGRLGATVCPECGTKVPPHFQSLAPWADRRDGASGALAGQVGPPTSPEVRRTAREIGLSAWHSLGFLSLAPILLLSPLPCLLPFGVATAVACGFAPAFRLFALRSLGALPAPQPSRTKTLLQLCRASQVAELGCVAVVLVYAAVATFGIAPRALTAVYFGTLPVWASLAALGLVAQIRLGDALAAQLDEPNRLPAAGSFRATAGLVATSCLALFGAVCLGLSAWPTPIGWLGGVATGILIVAALGLAACAIFARAHAHAVADRVYESKFLRAKERIDPMRAPREAFLRRTPPRKSARPASARDDEPPIPLA